MFCLSHQKSFFRFGRHAKFVRILEQNMKPLRAVATVVLLCAAPWAWGDNGLEQRVAAKDPKVIEQVIRNADIADPLILMKAAMSLLEAGQRDSAIFCFYAGQLRARYWPKLQGENSQILTVFLMTIGEQVNGVAFRDIPKLLKIIDEVVIWDERSFARWAIAMKLDPRDSSLLERRRKAVEGLVPYKENLLVQRETLEKYARNFKTPAEIDSAQQEMINREYSQEPVELNVSGMVFRVPANYLWPYRLNWKPDKLLTDKGFWVFLPDFGGFTKDNWREPNSNPDAILIRVQGNKEVKTINSQFESFFMNSGAPKVKIEGFDALFHDEQKYRLQLPDIIIYRKAYVIKSTKARGGDYYVICHAPDTGSEIVRSESDCQMFLGDANNNLRIVAYFNHKHLARMTLIEERLSSMLKSWMIRR